VKKIVLSIWFLLSVVSAFSEDLPQLPPNYRYVKTWRITDRFAKVDSIPVDTAHLNFQDANPIDRFSIANSYNGNLGSPIQSKLYFDRPENKDFLFSNAYYPYMMNVEHATFYNTKTPLSYINYITGGSQNRADDDFKFLYTGNFKKNLNVGTTLDYMSTIGEYMQQAATRFAGSLFGSYQGKHYSANAFFSTNSMRNQESGGLKNAGDIYFKNLAASDLEGNIYGQSNYAQKQIFYNHQYNIGIERPVRIDSDSVRMEYVPVTRFAHTIKYDNLSKRYYENAVEKNFYQHTYGAGSVTRDTAALQTLTNNFSISMEEEFNKWMNFGLTAFIENDIQRYVYTKDSVLLKDMKSTTKVGGILSKQRGRTFRYNVLGELSLLGYKAGDFMLKGEMGGFFRLLKDSISLIANGFVRSDKPSFFLQNYESNHFQWSNNFASVYRTHVGGTFAIPTRSLSLNVSVENITHYVYFDSLAIPTQFSGNIQVLALNLKKDFHFGKFTLENNVVYQVSSNTEALALPNLTLFHNLYYDDKWFSVLSVQFGANVRYNTAYYAPSYMPATGQFYSQSKTKIGNYPVLNVYLNCHLKRTRFFLEYYHLNNMFMKGAYYSMPNYPLAPANMRLGISWNFYD
jgi:hypothetical protein